VRDVPLGLWCFLPLSFNHQRSDHIHRFDV
jgi:hypothetical protein